MFFAGIGEVELAYFYFYLWWLGIAALVEGIYHLPWCFCSIVDLLQQLQTLQFSRSSHIVSFVSIEHLKIIELTIGSF